MKERLSRLRPEGTWTTPCQGVLGAWGTASVAKALAGQEAQRVKIYAHFH